jgi:hypothetical protein
MFFGFFKKFKTEQNDYSIDKNIDIISQKLIELDKDLVRINKNQELKIIHTLELEANTLYSLQKAFITRIYRLIERYNKINNSLNFRKKEAINKFNDFDKETKQKISILKNDKYYDNNQLNNIMKEYNNTKNSHDEYINKLKEIENRINSLKTSLKKTCKENAYDSKDVYDKI